VTSTLKPFLPSFRVTRMGVTVIVRLGITISGAEQQFLMTDHTSTDFSKSDDHRREPLRLIARANQSP
jgi:hypothetical protein